jgi:glucose-1-phosphate adenylyltransferase
MTPIHATATAPARSPARSSWPAAEGTGPALHRPATVASAARDTYALVLAGGRGSRLGPLTERRAKPAVPFAGKLKIIDFTLSNCVNSGIRRIGVLTQYKAQSLIRHLERGWGFLAASLGEFIDVAPAQQQQGEAWYGGTADAVWQNVELIREAAPRHVLVLGGDHVYKMNYASLVADHLDSGCAATVACIEVPLAEAGAFGVMSVDDRGRILAFDEKPADPRPLPGRPGHALASMGLYCFETEVLLDALADDARRADSSHDFGRDLIPALLARTPLHAHRFADSAVHSVGGEPYWRDVGTVDAYWQANMDLVAVVPPLDLYDDSWPILSQQRQLPPAKFVFDEEDRRGMAVDALVASGCIVSGAQVRRSVLFSKVVVQDGSRVDDSLLLPNVRVGRGVRLARVIIDKHCRLPDGFHAGVDPAADAARGFHRTPGGVTVVTPEMLGQRGRIG